MGNGNNTSSEKGFTDQLFDRIGEENISYSNKSNEEKKKYWVGVITRLIHSMNEGEKVNIAKYRDIEPDIDSFLPAIINNIESYHWEGREEIINNYFILDEKAKKALEVQSNISDNSQQVKNTIYTKTETIEGVDISNEELAEKVGDLFYDSLSSFISSLGEKIDNEEISILLKDASKNIMEAWRICLPYVSHDFPEMKHTTEIKGLNIDKEELSKRISNLVDSELKDFLEKLSIKIKKDGDADYYRKPKPRKKLGTELYACAEKLKLASEKIK